MVNKTISLSEEIFQRLKFESNASGLIDSLLKQHYEVTTPKTLEEKRAYLESIEVIDPLKVELKEKLIAEIEKVKATEDSEEEAIKKRLEAQAKAKREKDEDVVRLTEELKKLVKEPTKAQLNKYIFYSRNMPDKVKELVKKWTKEAQ